MAMMAMTTSSSISVNADRNRERGTSEPPERLLADQGGMQRSARRVGPCSASYGAQTSKVNDNARDFPNCEFLRTGAINKRCDAKIRRRRSAAGTGNQKP